LSSEQSSALKLRLLPCVHSKKRHVALLLRLLHLAVGAKPPSRSLKVALEGGLLIPPEPLPLATLDEEELKRS
jgi:hypothetical protein